LEQKLLYSAKFTRVLFQPFVKYFNENFWHVTQFSCSDCKSVDEQHSGAKLQNPQGNLSMQGDTFRVGIALLTAAS